MIEDILTIVIVRSKSHVTAMDKNRRMSDGDHEDTLSTLMSLFKKVKALFTRVMSLVVVSW